MRKIALVAAVYFAAILAIIALCTACGLTTGAAGAATEAGGSKVEANPIINVVNLLCGGKLVIAQGEDGKPKITFDATTGAPATIEGGVGFCGPVLVYGTEAASAKVSSGGGGTGATRAGEGGDVPLTLPIPTEYRGEFPVR